MKLVITLWIAAALIQEVVPSVLVRVPRQALGRQSLVHTEYEAKYEQKGKHGNESVSTVKGKQEITHDSCGDSWNEFADKCAALIKDLIASLANAVSSQPGDATNLQLHIKNNFRHFDNTHNCTCLNRTAKALSDLDFSSLLNNITLTTLSPKSIAGTLNGDGGSSSSCGGGECKAHSASGNSKTKPQGARHLSNLTGVDPEHEDPSGLDGPSVNSRRKVDDSSPGNPGNGNSQAVHPFTPLPVAYSKSPLDPQTEQNSIVRATPGSSNPAVQRPPSGDQDPGRNSANSLPVPSAPPGGAPSITMVDDDGASASGSSDGSSSGPRGSSRSSGGNGGGQGTPGVSLPVTILDRRGPGAGKSGSRGGSNAGSGPVHVVYPVKNSNHEDQSGSDPGSTNGGSGSSGQPGSNGDSASSQSGLPVGNGGRGSQNPSSSTTGNGKGGSGDPSEEGGGVGPSLTDFPPAKNGGGAPGNKPPTAFPAVSEGQPSGNSPQSGAEEGKPSAAGSDPGNENGGSGSTASGVVPAENGVPENKGLPRMVFPAGSGDQGSGKSPQSAPPSGSDSARAAPPASNGLASDVDQPSGDSLLSGSRGGSGNGGGSGGPSGSGGEGFPAGSADGGAGNGSGGSPDSPQAVLPVGPAGGSDTPPDSGSSAGSGNSGQVPLKNGAAAAAVAEVESPPEGPDRNGSGGSGGSRTAVPPGQIGGAGNDDPPRPVSLLKADDRAPGSGADNGGTDSPTVVTPLPVGGADPASTDPTTSGTANGNGGSSDSLDVVPPVENGHQQSGDSSANGRESSNGAAHIVPVQKPLQQSEDPPQSDSYTLNGLGEPSQAPTANDGTPESTDDSHAAVLPVENHKEAPPASAAPGNGDGDSAGSSQAVPEENTSPAEIAPTSGDPAVAAVPVENENQPSESSPATESQGGSGSDSSTVPPIVVAPAQNDGDGSGSSPHTVVPTEAAVIESSDAPAQTPGSADGGSADSPRVVLPAIAPESESLTGNGNGGPQNSRRAPPRTGASASATATAGAPSDDPTTGHPRNQPDYQVTTPCPETQSEPAAPPTESASTRPPQSDQPAGATDEDSPGLRPTTFQTTSQDPTPASVPQNLSPPPVTRPLSHTTFAPQEALASPSTGQKEPPGGQEEDEDEDCCSCEACSGEISDPKQLKETACKDLEDARRQLKAIFDKMKKRLKCGRKAPKAALVPR